MSLASASRTCSTVCALRMPVTLSGSSGLEDDDGGGDPGVVRQRHVHGFHTEVVGAREDRSLDLELRVAGRVVDDLGVQPAHPGRCAECLGERLLCGEPGGQRRRRPGALQGGEQPLAHRRSPLQRLLEPADVDHVDADAHDHGAYSTVTDLARLRGWSTSCPLDVASSQANSCSGTTDSIGWSSVGTWGSRTSTSAYGVTSSSPSSARTMVRAPRARTSWIPLIILPCSMSRPRGGTMQITGIPSSTSAIGPCLSSPAAKPSAWM